MEQYPHTNRRPSGKWRAQINNKQIKCQKYGFDTSEDAYNWAQEQINNIGKEPPKEPTEEELFAINKKEVDGKIIRSYMCSDCGHAEKKEFERCVKCNSYRHILIEQPSRLLLERKQEYKHREGYGI